MIPVPRIVIINPNSTVSMTDAMVRDARRAVADLDFEGWTSHDGPPSIQGAADGERAAPPLLDLVQKASDAGVDGIIIGCFDDTALELSARLARCPVIGIGQAAYQAAALRHWRFSVVTTMSVAIPVLEQNIERLGVSNFLSRVRASDVPVLDLEEHPDAALQPILAEAKDAEQHDQISAVILGCAGMGRVVSEVRRSLAVSVIDPVTSAARCMAWLSAPQA